MTMPLDEFGRSFDAGPLSRPEPLAALRAALRADRVSIGSIDPTGTVFEILVVEGESLLAPGTRLPSATSTHFSLAAAGALFVSPDFDCWNGFDLPVDRILRAHGFRCGAALPLAIAAGPRGALSVHFRTSNADALDRVTELMPFLDRLAARYLRTCPSAPRGARLTRREYEVLVGLDEGLRIKQIALALSISQATVKAHVRSIFRKLGATSRAEATRAARRQGLLHA